MAVCWDLYSVPDTPKPSSIELAFPGTIVQYVFVPNLSKSEGLHRWWSPVCSYIGVIPFSRLWDSGHNMRRICFLCSNKVIELYATWFFQ